MFGLAKATAFENDVQEIETPDGITVCGYYLTISQIRKIYTREGFTNPSVATKHINLWRGCGMVKTFVGDKFIFFLPDNEDVDESLALISRKKSRSEDTVVVGGVLA